MSNICWANRLQSIIKTCKRKGAMVKFVRGVNDAYVVEDKEITINSRRTKEHQCYVLLHELGHHIICRTSPYSKKYAVLNRQVSLRSLSRKILQLEEEVTAWHIGEQTAKSLGIHLGDKYQLLKAVCLKTHITALSLHYT